MSSSRVHYVLMRMFSSGQRSHRFGNMSVRPGSIEVTLLFAVPEEVSQFQVTYPAIAAGTTSLHDNIAKLR